MKVFFTAAAQEDLAEIGEWLAAHYPVVALHVEKRIRDVAARIGQWPESGPRSAKRQGVRLIPVGRYPYKIFYRVTEDAVEILHIHHTAQRPWDEQD